MATDCAKKLTQAKDALHALLIGEQIVSVTVNGRATSYGPSNISMLRRYIAELETECGNTTKGHAGPISFHG